MIKKGFTLIEILVAMTVVAVLMSIAFFSYQGARKAARDSKRKADLEEIRAALEIYRNDNKTYPESTSFLVSDYIQELPADPISDYKYQYIRISPNKYYLCAYLETGSEESATGCESVSCGNNSSITCNYSVLNP